MLTYEGACRGYAGVWHAYIRLCMHLEQLIQLDCNLPLGLVHLQATPVCSSTCRLPTSSFILLLLIPPNSGVNACRCEHCRWQSFAPQAGAKLVADVLGACVRMLQLYDSVLRVPEFVIQRSQWEYCCPTFVRSIGGSYKKSLLYLARLETL